MSDDDEDFAARKSDRHDFQAEALPFQQRNPGASRRGLSLRGLIPPLARNPIEPVDETARRLFAGQMRLGHDDKPAAGRQHPPDRLQRLAGQNEGGWKGAVDGVEAVVGKRQRLAMRPICADKSRPVTV